MIIDVLEERLDGAGLLGGGGDAAAHVECSEEHRPTIDRGREDQPLYSSGSLVDTSAVTLAPPATQAVPPCDSHFAGSDCGQRLRAQTGSAASRHAAWR